MTKIFCVGPPSLEIFGVEGVPWGSLLCVFWTVNGMKLSARLIFRFV